MTKHRGKLEVETDLLLGVDDVPLPLGVTVGAGTDSALAPEQRHVASAGSRATPPTKPVSVPSRGFEAALFEAKPRQAESTIAPVTANPGAATAPSATATQQVAAVPTSLRTPSAPERVKTGAGIALRESVALPQGSDAHERLTALEAQHAAHCPHCTNARGHTRLVFGEGNPKAELVFVGEAPGDDEDAAGRPFVGRVGEKLNEMIQAMGLSRADVYIATVLKSRPEGNRPAAPDQLRMCGTYLLAQCSIIRPKVIVTLGGPATKIVLGSELGITMLRGTAKLLTLGTLGSDPFDTLVIPTFHPASLLREPTVEMRRDAWNDLRQVLAAIGREAPPRKPGVAT